MKRRSRFFPTSKGTPVYGSPRQLDVLDLLQRYDCLPSNYIRAAFDAPAYTQKVLNLLNQEGFIGVPEEAKHHINARYRPTILEIRPKGEALLAKNDKWLGREKSVGHFRHKHMVSVIQFSFQMAAKGDIKFKTQEEIIARSSWKPSKDDSNPAHIPLGTYKIIPDAPMFGLSLGKHTIHFHGFEADRGTEPLSSSADRQNITSKVQHYSRYLREKIYAKRYGLQRISILFVACTPQRALAIQTIIGKEAKDLAHHFHVKAIADFVDHFPPPTDHMTREDWLDGFNILNTLEATRERSKTGEGVRVDSAA